MKSELRAYKQKNVWIVRYKLLIRRKKSELWEKKLLLQWSFFYYYYSVVKQASVIWGDSHVDETFPHTDVFHFHLNYANSPYWPTESDFCVSSALCIATLLTIDKGLFSLWNFTIFHVANVTAKVFNYKYRPTLDF